MVLGADRAPFSLMDLVSRKDTINPASGRSHTAGRMYPALERLLPPLEEKYAKITRQAMWRVYKKKAKQKLAAKAKAMKAVKASVATGATSVTTNSPEMPAPTTSSRPAPSITPGAPKARKSKSRKTPKQKNRKRLEQLYDGYKLLEGDGGLVIEDSK